MPISTRPVTGDTDTPFSTACLSHIASSTGYNLSSPFSRCLMCLMWVWGLVVWMSKSTRVESITPPPGYCMTLHFTWIIRGEVTLTGGILFQQCLLIQSNGFPFTGHVLSSVCGLKKRCSEWMAVILWLWVTLATNNNTFWSSQIKSERIVDLTLIMSVVTFTDYWLITLGAFSRGSSAPKGSVSVVQGVW